MVSQPNVKDPIVLSIAGSDPTAGAGIQADVKTCAALGVDATTVITALTAQNDQAVYALNATPVDVVLGQLEAVLEQCQPHAIKLGMLASSDICQALKPELATANVPIVYDPVLAASVGDSLNKNDDSFLESVISLLPYINVLTPNRHEAERLLKREIHSEADVAQAAADLSALGPQVVVIKGGHFDESKLGQAWAQDYYHSTDFKFYLSSPRQNYANNHGTGCVFASSFAAALAKGYEYKDAAVIAKMTVNQGLRQAKALGRGRGGLSVTNWPDAQQDLPILSVEAAAVDNRPSFPECTADKALGLYPVVDSAQWIKRLLALGVTTIQLRNKNLSGAALEKEIAEAVALGRSHQARVFINDHWQLAIKHQAYGIHLGQEDLDQADFHAIARAGIRLGVSNHAYYELARAHYLQPSYLAIGPLWATTSKDMPWVPQGAEFMAYWAKMLDYPLVGIGGINLERAQAVAAAGANGVALITAITEADDPDAACLTLMAAMNEHVLATD